MNETQRRIKAYKAALPGLRERVIAVALLLAMSVAMMTSATFAWLTISQAPAVSGASTTVAANGNLEIALAKTDGSQPDESKVGDSSATTGNTVANANLTWGNLVNLADPSYGLDNLVLRPAMLSSSQNLLSNPLVSVFYGQDGRAESNYNRDFAFTNWNSEREFFEFSPTPRYGVRAISTIEYKIQDSTMLEYRTLYGYAETANGRAGTEYRKIIGNDVPEGNKPENHNNNIKVIAKMLGAFISESILGDTETMDCAGYVKDLYNMVVEFESAYDAVGDALAAMANVQVFSTYGINDYKAHLYDRDDLVLESNGKKVANTAQLKTDGVTLDSLSYYVSDLNTLAFVKEGLKPFYDKVVEAEKELQTVQILWPEIEEYVGKLVVIGTCTVQVGENGTPLTPGQLSSNLGTAMNILGSSQVIGTIKQGLIVNYEQLSGEKMNLQYVLVENSVKNITVRYIRTSAKAPGRIQNDLEKNCSMENSSSNLEGSAQDTYGLAVDMWVRTNTDGVRLILEGNVLTEDTYEKATMTIPGGQTVDLYTATVTYPESEESEGEAGDDSGSLGDKVDEILGNSETVDVYMLTRDVVDDAGNVTGTEDVWYFADTHAEVYKRNEDGSISTTPNRSKGESEAVSVSISTTQKMNTITNVIGYYGENRVWEDAKAWEDTSLLNVSSTTQGSGSCYVFYADNPTDQENSLKLLSNLRVAFLNEEGKLVAKAKLDTMNHYATPGKVIVPLVLMIDSDVTSPTYTGDDLAIVALERNEATRLTMVVYLDGTNLTNDQVLAANDIQGKLNVQFGSSVALNTIGDEVLETAELHVSASVKDGETEFDYDTHTGDMTTHVTVNVDGIAPATVKGYFIRQVNATQGSREATPVVFEAKGNGVYEGAYTFTAPGTYILRSVELDGQEYELEGTYPKVTVKGFAMSSVVCSGCNPGEITSLLTGNNSISRAVSVSFLTDDRAKMPNSVQVQFLSNDGGDPVTVLMAYNATSGSFEGNAVFNKSGSYTMRYVIMDGDYVDLGNLDDEDTSDELVTLDITLGVYVQIADEIDGNRFDYEGKSIAVPMLVQIYNESDKILAGLQNVELHYAKEGTLQDAPDANLTWDAKNQRYYGTIQLAKPGKYAFDYVLVGGNLITKTTGTPPDYTVISPDPVVYVKGTEDGAFTEDYQFMSSGTATMAVRLGYAESATVYAVMKNTSTGTEETVQYNPDLSSEKGTDANGMSIREFVFNIPSTTQHGQDGTWVITEIQMADVCDDNQNYYDDTNRLVWTMAADDADEIADTIQTKVQSLVFDIRRDANTTAQTTYQTKADGSTYAFMETTTGDKNAYFDFTDKLGNALDSSIVISDVQAVYTLMANTSETHGGYIADFLKANIDTTYNLTKTNATTYTLPANTVALNYAGEYRCTKVSYRVNGTEYGYYQGSVYGTVDADMPSYIYKTVKPTVTVKSVTPAGSVNTTVTFTSSGPWYSKSYSWSLSGSATNGVTGNTVTAFAMPSKSGTNDSDVTFTKPSVTFTVSGVDKDSTVSFTIEAGTSVPTSNNKTGYAQADTFTKKGNGDASVILGDTISGYISKRPLLVTYSTYAYCGHGTKVIKGFTITRGTATYTVTLDEADWITIVNPSTAPTDST